ncbi:MAG: glycosyltransferase, partial [Clostridia bacterium]|nr:glycosyltransferase [Clostridia bacterium]
MLISVMMSTYNGEKYLREQLDSILAQTLPDGFSLKIIVRDDGSTDATLSVLEEYCEKYSGVISYYTGVNLRPAKSFWHLLKNCPQSDFYSFSDQDDYWYKDKLKRGIEAIQAEPDQSIPLLYTSNVMVADSVLNPVDEMNSTKQYTDFAHMLIYNLSNGCTQVFNNCARDEFIKYDMDSNLVIMHDRLADLLTVTFGKIIYDDKPSMLY